MNGHNIVKDMAVQDEGRLLRANNLTQEWLEPPLQGFSNNLIGCVKETDDISLQFPNSSCTLSLYKSAISPQLTLGGRQPRASATSTIAAKSPLTKSQYMMKNSAMISSGPEHLPLAKAKEASQSFGSKSGWNNQDLAAKLKRSVSREVKSPMAVPCSTEVFAML